MENLGLIIQGALLLFGVAMVVIIVFGEIDKCE